MWQLNSPAAVSPVMRGWITSSLVHVMAFGALIVVSNDRHLPVQVSLAAATPSSISVEVSFSESVSEPDLSEVQVEVFPRAARIEDRHFRQAPSTVNVDPPQAISLPATASLELPAPEQERRLVPTIDPPSVEFPRRQVVHHRRAVAAQPAVAVPVSRTTLPEFQDNRPPNYPESAISRGWEGTVLLRLELAADGTVSEVTVLRSSGHPVLDAEAVSAVRTWTATPATEDGRAIATTVRLPVTFRLPRSGR